MKRIASFIKTLLASQSVVSSHPHETESKAHNLGGEDKHTFWSDVPIQKPEEDRFHRREFAARIADIIAQRTDSSSIVLGIYGAWGDGKTSILNLLRESLKTREDVVHVTFNPWHFQSQAQLLKGFFATLTNSLGTALPSRKEELGRYLEDYGSVLSLASLSLLGGLISISPGQVLKDLGSSLSQVNLEHLRDRVDKILGESGKRVVVLIDDIDRLDREEIHAIFKLVKLSAGFRSTTYVLAFDANMVADALGEKYGSGNPEAGRGFLEKIIQVPLQVPAADTITMRHFTFEGVDKALTESGVKLLPEDGQKFARHFVDSLEIRLATPRQARRYCNALAFAIPILKGEVHLVDQMLIEGIRTFYPNLYSVIRDNPDLFAPEHDGSHLHEDQKKKALEIIQQGLHGLTTIEEKGAKELLQRLFPRIKGVLGNTSYGSDWDVIWEREQRICSSRHFRRYFQYTIPEGDVPDQAVTSLLSYLDEPGAEATTEDNIRELTKRGSAASLIRKLRLHEDAISPEPATRLASALSHCGELFPREKGMLFSSTMDQAAILIMKLVKRLSSRVDRDVLAKRLLQEASPLPFAFECFRWIRKDKDEQEEDRLVSADTEDSLGQTFAERTRDFAQTASLHAAFKQDSPALYWLWSKYRAPEEVGEHLKEEFKHDPESVTRFLLCYLGSAWEMETGLPTRSHFTRESYDSISKLVDSKVIFEHLKAKYGEKLGVGDYHTLGRLPSLEEAVANQFACIHLNRSCDSKS